MEVLRDVVTSCMARSVVGTSSRIVLFWHVEAVRGRSRCPQKRGRLARDIDQLAATVEDRGEQACHVPEAEVTTKSLKLQEFKTASALGHSMSRSGNYSFRPDFRQVS